MVAIGAEKWTLPMRCLRDSGLTAHAWSLQEPHPHHLGACYKCSISGPIPDLLGLNFHFYKTAR